MVCPGFSTPHRHGARIFKQFADGVLPLGEEIHSNLLARVNSKTGIEIKGVFCNAKIPKFPLKIEWRDSVRPENFRKMDHP